MVQRHYRTWVVFIEWLYLLWFSFVVFVLFTSPRRNMLLFVGGLFRLSLIWLLLGFRNLFIKSLNKWTYIRTASETKTNPKTMKLKLFWGQAETTKIWFFSWLICFLLTMSPTKMLHDKKNGLDNVLLCFPSEIRMKTNQIPYWIPIYPSGFSIES